MTDFYERVLQDPQAALRSLDGSREEDFALLMGGIDHADDNVRARLIEQMYHRVFEGSFRPYRDKLEQVLDAVRARYPNENSRVQGAIIRFFKLYALREGMKDREEFRPIQLHALRHSNPETLMDALEWSIYFYNEEVGGILRDLMMSGYDRKVRGRAMVVEMSLQETMPRVDMDTFIEMLTTQSFPWQTLALRCLKHISHPDDIRRLAEVGETPRLDLRVKETISRHLSQIVPKSDLDETEKDDLKYRFGPMKELSDLLGTEVTQPLSSEQTWQIAIEQILSGKASYNNVGVYIYSKLFNRTMLERLEKDVFSRMPESMRERITHEHQRLWSYINRMDMM
jgi:hypothetical protein